MSSPCRTYRVRLFDLGEPKALGPKQFFPADEIIRLFSKQVILELLQCSCETCENDRRYSEGYHAQRPIAGFHEEYIDKILNHALCLFALLVFIHHPVFIIGFVQEGESSATLRAPKNYNVDDLAIRYWTRYDEQYRDESRMIAAEFRSHVHQFSVPKLDGTYQKYQKAVILPFLNEEMIGKQDDQGNIQPEGSYGKVFKLEIPPYYVAKMPGTENITKFARKELNSSSNAAFWLENHNLRISKLFDSKHIVRMLKAYKHGGVFNILFPCAKTNLDRFLRDESSESVSVLEGPLEHNPLWEQMLGIMTALRDMHIGYKDFDEEEDRPWIGYHFDLKPANVLIDEQNVWAISDFGQASFKKRSGDSSSITNQGGTDAYSAPEIELERASRLYDMWSMGCILLEVTAFLVRGAQGLTGENGLDKVRRTRPEGARGEDARFWYRTTSGSYAVKQSILTFMENLTGASPSLGPNTSSRQFLESVLLLIKDMLNPDKDRRLDPETAVVRLQEIRGRTEPVGRSRMPPPVPYRGQTQVGQKELEDRLFWHLRDRDARRLEGGAVGVKMYLFEDARGLRIVLDSVPGGHVETNVVRKRAVFVPVYAFRAGKPHAYSSKHHFYISTEDNRSDFTQKFPYVKSSISEAEIADLLIHLGLGFAVSPDINDFKLSNAHAAQTAFTGQYVHASFALRSFTIQPYKDKNMFGRFNTLRRRNGASKVEPPGDTFGVIGKQVQLWEDLNIIEPIDSSKTSEARPRRIAIFHDRKITLVRMDAAISAEHRDDGKHGALDPKMLRLVRAAPDKTDNFPFLTIEPPNACQDDGALNVAGIPLHAQELGSLEKKSKEICDSMDLLFNKDEESKCFYDKYFSMKFSHRIERKNLERERPAIPR